VKIAIALPSVEELSIMEIVIRATEIGLTARAKIGAALFADAKLIIRDGDTMGVTINTAPTTLQGAIVENGRRTPTGRTDLMKVIGEAIVSDGDIFAAAEKCGKAAGWFLG
jgi:hypothetical protein